MIILTPGCSWKTRLRAILRATKEHALNLAKFVSLYKVLLLLQQRINGGKERSADTFVAGLIGGYVVFGNRTAVNEQVCFYLLQYIPCPTLPPDRALRCLKGRGIVSSALWQALLVFIPVV